jgi:hypothetical protein
VAIRTHPIVIRMEDLPSGCKARIRVCAFLLAITVARLVPPVMLAPLRDLVSRSRPLGADCETECKNVTIEFEGFPVILESFPLISIWVPVI